MSCFSNGARAEWPTRAERIALAFEGPVEVRLVALDSIEDASPTLKLRFLRRALEDRDESIVRKGLQLVDIVSARKLEEELLEVGAKGSEDLAHLALEKLTGPLGREAVATLVGIIGARSKNTRTAGILALGKASIELRTEIERIVVPWLLDASAEVRQAACRILGQVGGDKTRGSLGLMLLDGERAVRLEASLALAVLGDELNQAGLMAALNDTDSEIRTRALLGLTLLYRGQPLPAPLLDRSFEIARNASLDREGRQAQALLEAASGVPLWGRLAGFFATDTTGEARAFVDAALLGQAPSQVDTDELEQRWSAELGRSQGSTLLLRVSALRDNSAVWSSALVGALREGRVRLVDLAQAPIPLQASAALGAYLLEVVEREPVARAVEAVRLLGRSGIEPEALESSLVRALGRRDFEPWFIAELLELLGASASERARAVIEGYAPSTHPLVRRAVLRARLRQELLATAPSACWTRSSEVFQHLSSGEWFISPDAFACALEELSRRARLQKDELFRSLLVVRPAPLFDNDRYREIVLRFWQRGAPASITDRFAWFLLAARVGVGLSEPSAAERQVLMEGAELWGAGAHSTLRAFGSDSNAPKMIDFETNERTRRARALLVSSFRRARSKSALGPQLEAQLVKSACAWLDSNSWKEREIGMAALVPFPQAARACRGTILDAVRLDPRRSVRNAGVPLLLSWREMDAEARATLRRCAVYESEAEVQSSCLRENPKMQSAPRWPEVLWLAGVKADRRPQLLFVRELSRGTAPQIVSRVAVVGPFGEVLVSSKEQLEVTPLLGDVPP